MVQQGGLLNIGNDQEACQSAQIFASKIKLNNQQVIRFNAV